MSAPVRSSPSSSWTTTSWSPRSTLDTWRLSTVSGSSARYTRVRMRWRWSRELHPDLMLLDVYLPDMTGIEVLRRVRQDHPGVDVIVVTAARELDTVREALRGGAVSYLVKPFEYEALGERLEHYRRTHSALSASDTAEQKQMTSFSGSPAIPAARPAALPKGLSRETALAVLAILSREEPMSATECAQRIGLSRVSARRYLEHLEQTGVAAVTLRYGVGRPERLYRLL